MAHDFVPNYCSSCLVKSRCFCSSEESHLASLLHLESYYRPRSINSQAHSSYMHVSFDKPFGMYSCWITVMNYSWFGCLIGSCLIITICILYLWMLLPTFCSSFSIICQRRQFFSFVFVVWNIDFSLSFRAGLPYWGNCRQYRWFFFVCVGSFRSFFWRAGFISSSLHSYTSDSWTACLIYLVTKHHLFSFSIGLEIEVPDPLILRPNFDGKNQFQYRHSFVNGYDSS